MKKFLLIVAASLLIMLFSINAQSTAACGGRFRCSDPQLCVNSQLLTIVPDFKAGGDEYVFVPKGTKVDFTVANCGGTLEPVPEDHVVIGGVKNLQVLVVTEPRTPATVSYGDETLTKQNGLGLIRFTFNMK